MGAACKIMKHKGFYCFSPGSVTYMMNFKRHLICLWPLKIIFLFQMYFLMMFVCMYWSKLPKLLRDNGYFLAEDMKYFWKNVSDWAMKNQDTPKLISSISKSWPVLANLHHLHHIIFSTMNDIWLNSTSVFTHTSNIYFPVNILSIGIFRIGSQVCIMYYC